MSYRSIFLNRYILPEVTAGWSPDGKNVKTVNRRTGIGEERDIDSLFYENLIVDNKDYEKGVYENVSEKFLSSLDRIKDGDREVLRELKEDITLFVAAQYMLGPNSSGAIRSYLISNIDWICRLKDFKSLLAYGNERLRKRDYSTYIENAYTVRILSTYLWDLKVEYLSAPEGSPFILGDYPLVKLNNLSGGEAGGYVNSFKWHGLVLILPISPYRAVTLYDPEAYRLKKDGGIYMLSEDDVDTLNGNIAQRSVLFVYRPSEERGDDYYFGLMNNNKEIPDTGDFVPSIYLTLASTLKYKQDEERAYARNMTRREKMTGISILTVRFMEITC